MRYPELTITIDGESVADGGATVIPVHQGQYLYIYIPETPWERMTIAKDVFWFQLPNLSTDGASPVIRYDWEKVIGDKRWVVTLALDFVSLPIVDTIGSEDTHAITNIRLVVEESTVPSEEK